MPLAATAVAFGGHNLWTCTNAVLPGGSAAPNATNMIALSSSSLTARSTVHQHLPRSGCASRFPDAARPLCFGTHRFDNPAVVQIVPTVQSDPQQSSDLTKPLLFG
jgi:hypothetical protein